MGFRCRSVGVEGFWGLGVLGSCTDLGTQQPRSQQQQDEARQPHSAGQGAVRSRAPLSPFPAGGSQWRAHPLATPPPPKPRPLSPKPRPLSPLAPPPAGGGAPVTRGPRR